MSKVKPEVWLVDVDGTVALRERNGRGPFDWARVSEDLPHVPVIQLVRALLRSENFIIFMSGRNEVCRRDTWSWLNREIIGDDPHLAKVFDIYVVKLLMRPDTEERRYQRDDELKRWLYDVGVRFHYDVIGVLDDRDRVVTMWRSLGLTCLQVAEGNF